MKTVSALIANNTQRQRKTLYTNNAPGVRLRVCSHPQRQPVVCCCCVQEQIKLLVNATTAKEAEHVADEILKRRAQHSTPYEQHRRLLLSLCM